MSDPLIRTVFLAHLAATLLMTGVIWFVQVVHYPLFADIGKAGFSSYEQRVWQNFLAYSTRFP